MTKKYMHTLDGRPAYFEPRLKQIFFAARGTFNAVRLVDTVKEIHQNERISIRTRHLEGPLNTAKFEHGWVNVLI